MAEHTNVYGTYWRLGYWLCSVPLIKMMQCAVTRRRIPARKKANLLHGPHTPGLATLIAAKDQQVEQCVLNHPDRHYKSPKCSSSPGAITLDDTREKDVAETGGDGLRKQGYGEGSFNSGPLQRVCLGNSARHYPYSKVAEIREARRASLERKMVMRKHIAPQISSPLSPVSPLGRQRVVPEMLTADDTTGKFAYISLDGRLINAELATSATNIGGGLGVEEAQAWEDFAPIYRVLIVALSAAASSAAKDKNSMEIQRLLKIVTEQEKELVLMRQQLSDQLRFQAITDPGNLDSRTEHLEWAPSTGTAETLQNLESPVHPELGDVRCFEGEETDKNVEALERADVNCPIDLPLKSVLQVDPGLTRSDCDVLSNDLKITRDDAVNKDVVLVETPLRKDLTTDVLRSVRETNSLFEKCADEEAKWYVNPMVDAAEDYYDMCTPERDNPIFSTCTPAIRRSFERTVLRSSIKKRDKWNLDSRLSSLAGLAPASPLQVIPCRLSKESVTPILENRCVDEEVMALRAQCAAALLKLKTKVMTVLGKEGTRCMAERNVSAAEGTALVASLLSAVAGCWRDTVPQALAALGLSPSEYNSCLRNNTQRRKSNASQCARDADGWRQFLEEHDIDEQEVEQKSSRVAALCLCASNFQQLSVCKSSNDHGREESPEREPVNLLCAPEADEESTSSSVVVGQVASNSRSSDKYPQASAETQGKFVHRWENPSEWLDNASAEVADLEMHMKMLQQDVSGYEAERDKFESKLTESIHVENQAKLHRDIVELGARLQMKGVQFAETIGQQQHEEAETVDLAKMRRELQLKETKIADLTCVVQSKESLIADMEANMHADLEEMARQLQLKEYKILELKGGVQLKGLEVADLERKLKAKLSLDVAEMTRQLQLIESKVEELTTRLHLKDLEIADLERAQKVILMAKDQELSALRENCIRSDAQLDEVTAAVQTTGIAISDRISTLEYLCSRKDSKICELKQDLQALKTKIKPLQSSAMFRGRRSFIPYAPPPILSGREVASSESQKNRNSAEMSPPLSSIKNGPIYPHFKDLQDTSISEAGALPSPPPVEVSEERPSADKFYQERDFMSAASVSTEGDGPSSAEESDRTVQNDKENAIKTGVRSPHSNKKLRTSTNGLRTAKPSATSNNVASKPKRATADLCRNSTSSTGNVASLNRVRASMTFTSSLNPKTGPKQSSKSSIGNPVVISKKLRKRVIISPRRGQANVKPLSSLPPNTPGNTKRSSIGRKYGVNSLVGDGVSMDAASKENAAVKRRRWAGFGFHLGSVITKRLSDQR